MTTINTTNNKFMTAALEEARAELTAGSVIGSGIGLGVVCALQKKRNITGRLTAGVVAAKIVYDTSNLPDEAIIASRFDGVTPASMALGAAVVTSVAGWAADALFGTDKD